MKSNSSCPKYDIPSIVLKKCKNSLCKPIRLFCQKSFETGQIPQEYKNQLIIPLHKKGLKTKPANYRPVSLTAHIIKILERIIRKVIVSFFEKNKLFNETQHGFRNQRSCSTQLLSHVNSILANSMDGKDTDCVYVDFAKAFDKVDHGILVNKFRYYKLSDKYVIWIKDFLENRVQTVSLNNQYSYSTPVTSGVPQGSVLGPLLFIIYINDLPSVVNTCKMLTFADDTKICTGVSTEMDTKSLQNDLNNIIAWSQENNMELNESKFEFICHKLSSENQTQKFFSELPFYNDFLTYTTSNTVPIFSSSHVRDLGVLIDSKLTWDFHISNVASKAKRVCAWILGVFYSRDRQTLLTLFNSLT